MVWVLFTTLYICQLSSANLPVISIFLTFEASPGCLNILFNPLEAVDNLHFFGKMGLIKCQDVSVGFYLLTILSDRDSFDIHHALFSRGTIISSVVANAGSLLLTTTFRSVQFLVWICLTFGNVEAFYLENVIRLPLTVHLI